MLAAWVRALVVRVVVSDGSNAELDRALAFLGSDYRGTTVSRVSERAAVVLGVAGGAVALLTGRLAYGIPCLMGATVVGFAGPRVPPLLADAKRTRALGTAPSVVVRATLAMELTASPEYAARFAAETGDGPLAESLDGHVRRSIGGADTGFQSFTTEWHPWFPELGRACSLVESASVQPPDQRPKSLERARAVVLDAARDRVSAFAAAIRPPATAVYAFGVLLPLSLVSLLPALRAAGVPAPTAAIVVVYDVVLPLVLLAASAWLVARRPVAFPPPSVDRSHPDVPSGSWRAPLVGLVAAGVAGWVSQSVLPGWTTPIAAVGAGVGSALAVRYRPLTSVHESVRAVEDGLDDALLVLGRRIERGESVERALPAVAEAHSGPTGAVFAEAARRQRRLGVGVDAAFLGSNGALSTVPSERARGAASLLALAATEGRPAGSAVVAMGEHLGALRSVERDARRAVEQVTSTLSHTGAVFGPLVGGATVALAGAMGSAGPLTGTESVSGLGLAVGVYVLVLSVLLTTLSTGLARGFERAIVGYRAGLSLLTATATYLAAFAGTGLTV